MSCSPLRSWIVNRYRCLPMRSPVILLAVLLVIPATAFPDTTRRIVILREGASRTLDNGKLTLELLKIRGYTVDIRFQGDKQKLKRGDSLRVAGSGCSVTFQKVSPETRIARFLTDCS